MSAIEDMYKETVCHFCKRNHFVFGCHRTIPMEDCDACDIVFKRFEEHRRLLEEDENYRNEYWDGWF